MTDEELDREIEATLAVDPSPELVARVRSEVAHQAVAPAVPWGWAIASAAVVAVTIAAMSTVRNVEVARLKPSPALVAAPSEVVTGPEVAGPVEISKPAKVLLRYSPAPPDMPEVIVDPNAVQAFRHYVTSVSERRFEASFDDNAISTPWDMTELSVPAITVEPLERPAANN
jgi:hypothetical protein